MTSSQDILIIGSGKVGSATGRSFRVSPAFHDPAKGMVNENFNLFKYLIVCVDTLQSGPTDYSDLDSVLSMLPEYKGTVVIRSTISPEKIDKIKNENLFSLIMFPEFMNHEDFKNNAEANSRIVLGGDEKECLSFLKIIVDLGYPCDSGYYIVSATEASIIKLSSNAALATKLITFNIIHNLCEKYSADYESVRVAIASDIRIGPAHTIVPSPEDSMLGFGGHCLPKDILAIADMDDFGFFKKVNKINKLLGR
jgi:UDP-glucose 6-dehydrogenase